LGTLCKNQVSQVGNAVWRTLLNSDKSVKRNKRPH